MSNASGRQNEKIKTSASVYGRISKGVESFDIRHFLLCMDYHPLVFTGNLSDTLPEWLKQFEHSQQFILTDKQVAKSCLPLFLQKSGLPSNTPCWVMPTGEQHKTIHTCEQVWSAMLAAQLDRKALLINVGGGVVGDLGGFCAAVFKRGIPFIHVPTTLLAMTDAAIGGKTGVDFQGLKNIIGAFYHPEAVWVDPDFLQSLPESELRSGIAEILKHALIGDAELLKNLSVLLQSGSFARYDWKQVLASSIAVKIRVVQDDPRESGLRALLNYGHTIGHALESYFLDGPRPMSHGEAIAHGIILEEYLREPLRSDLEAIKALIQRIFPLRTIPVGAWEGLWDLMQADKKNINGRVQVVLPGSTPFSMVRLSPDKAYLMQRLAGRAL